jgi:two-component system nitrogen regulation response regulator GlnG
MTRIEKSSIIASGDSVLINQMIDVLLQYDYSVTIEKSIIKIISRILESEVNLLILDLDAPQELNFDSIDIIRKLRPRLPIIVLSMDNSLETLKTLVQKGVFYSTIKPATTEEIEEVVKAIIRFNQIQKNNESLMKEN